MYSCLSQKHVTLYDDLPLHSSPVSTNNVFQLQVTSLHGPHVSSGQTLTSSSDFANRFYCISFHYILKDKDMDTVMWYGHDKFGSQYSRPSSGLF